MNTPADSAKSLKCRPLAAADLDTVIAIDAAITGARREEFFKRRLAAAEARPSNYVFVGAEAEKGKLVAYMLGRILSGEFGSRDRVIVLDGVGADPANHVEGAGSALIDAVEDISRAKNISRIQTQVDWRDGQLLHFLDGVGFRMSSRLVLSRELSPPLGY